MSLEKQIKKIDWKESIIAIGGIALCVGGIYAFIKYENKHNYKLLEDNNRRKEIIVKALNTINNSISGNPNTYYIDSTEIQEFKRYNKDPLKIKKYQIRKTD